MKTLRSFIAGRWQEGTSDFVTLVNPSTEEPLARASSTGVDFREALVWARTKGGPALRGLTFAQRGEMLKAASKVLRENREELLAISRDNAGTTAGDGSFDVDGASGALHYYSALGRSLGDRRTVVAGDGVQIGKTEAAWVQHVLVPMRGVAVHINAFNFPAWGFAEKAACAWLAGMPVITKPASATALLTERCVELILAANVLPEGALQLICGATGDLLDHLTHEDVLAFTGSADTARTLRDRDALKRAGTRVNVEADSVNAAVLAAGVTDGPSFDLFVRDVTREITQKAGQKCTAVRRIFVPGTAADRVQEALAAKLAKTVVGNPADESVRMGPLSTASQLADALAGVKQLSKSAKLIVGSGERANGVGSPEGKGYFLAPTLLRAEADAGSDVHRLEVFAPVATLIAYDGSPADAARTVGLGGGMLVTSVYGDDAEWLSSFVAEGGASSGRIYLGSSSFAPEAPGSGAAFPQALHGGPGRAGGGAELGGPIGLELYMQRVALQGSREMVEGLLAR